jgi:hypothetical protein
MRTRGSNCSFDLETDGKLVAATLGTSGTTNLDI